MRLSALLAIAIAAAGARAEVTITSDRNLGGDATPAFRFRNVPPPSKDDAAARASVIVVGGKIDGNSGPLSALTDGALPGGDDEPESNLFFNAGTWGGRVRLDFGRPLAVAQINTYSWHSDGRGPQVYKVYASNGDGAGFDAAPKSTIDPETCGWTLIAFVDTRPKEGEYGGQYAVSIADSSGVLGTYRYLLFDLFEAESSHDWGNTFYSELDVIGAGNVRQVP